MELVGIHRNRSQVGGAVCSAMFCAAGGLVLATLFATLAPRSLHTMAAAIGIGRAQTQAPGSAPSTAPRQAEQKPAPYRTMAAGGLMKISHEGRPLAYYQARPEGDGPWPGVILASSGWGIDADFKAIAGRLAAAGFFVMAPEINGGKVANDADKAREMGVLADTEKAIGDLNAMANHLKFREEVGDHRVGLVGFDSGGRIALMAARVSEDISCVVSVQGAPESDVESLRRINMPILAIFGGADPLTPAASIATFRQALDAAGRTFELKVYDSAGRGFTHSTEAGYDEATSADALGLIVAFLRSHL